MIIVGYTYSSNPINEDVAFFNIPATAIIKNAFQFGLSYELSDRLNLDGVFYYGFSGDATEGQILNPQAVTPTNLFGAIPGTTVSYDMTAFMIMVGVNYKFKKKVDD
ncbi:MAG: hypothetical protein HKP48_03685 [Winogradskyella sp.]|uniref:hypothetical protein n=1 Tax=Winogradskyella sp. TaxID=1883156 RepID=UPI001811FAE6|nr:hypothetical protein [Winogradskyella sp.]MBT8244452.1 hypothetical protein [Winogradskyella sp.]NNK22404.1 hypothetical protein [Winogradskyella sp.]